ncbi:MAG: AIR synthase-related protein [Bacteroidales bacterium]|nr:AIR synthase-related protein [Bacteroidales bacterium]MCM1414695.1 AIR synthase-related protein [bacterium]MCM1422504.1 AIR synthase-related protein [bacterium]
MKQENDKTDREKLQYGAGREEVCAVSACADQDIVASKWIALEGTAHLAGQHRERLRERFPARMVDEAAAFDRYFSVAPEAATAIKSGVCGMRGLSRSGIFAGLWEMAQEAGVGLEVDLRKIPVRQETIEICEVFGENPYELASGGCLLMTAEHGNVLAEALMREGIPAAVIGRTTRGKERVLYNQGRKRYLNKPRE